MIKILKIEPSNPLFEDYKFIRKVVFVDEQGVPEEEEFDEFENDCIHFLAVESEKPAGTARWRRLGDKFKLERFAVLDEHRGSGIGRALVLAVEEDIKKHHDPAPGALYMHAQNKVLDFYKGLGYSTQGDVFEECGIKHTTMIK